jgi:transporter family protein
MITETWQFWAILSAMFAALTAIFAKLGAEQIDSDLATLIRTGMIFVSLAILAAATGKLTGVSHVTRPTWAFLLLSAVATGASWLCYFRAMQRGNVSQVAPVDKLSLVLVAVFAAVFLGERLSLRNWMGILLVAVGIAMVSWKR